MEAAQYRRLILENALKQNTDPKAAVKDFVDVVTQLGDARRTGDETQRQLVDLGPQFAHYKSGEPFTGDLLSERDLRRSYAILKTRLRATNRGISILTNASNALLGATYLHQGRPVHIDGASPSAMVPRISTEVGELVVLEDPEDDGEFMFIEMIG